MFEDSLLESGGGCSRLQRRAPWTTVMSFAIEGAMICVLLLIPLIYTEGLPKLRLTEYIIAPGAPSAPAPVQVVETRVVARGAADNDRTFRQPAYIPNYISRESGPEAAQTGAIEPGMVIPGSIPGGAASALIASIAAAAPVVVRPAAPATVKVSEGVTAGLLIRKVQPVYPALARQTRVSGSVVLKAMIGKDGAIENLRVVSGHPMLLQSAMEAVRQWRYKPYFLNGQPVEVDTQVTVRFSLETN